MTDSRVVKLAAHYMRLDDGHDVEPGVDQVDEARSHAHWTITDLEAAGLTVVDTTDAALINRVARLLWLGDHDGDDTWDILTSDDEQAIEELWDDVGWGDEPYEWARLEVPCEWARLQVKHYRDAGAVLLATLRGGS